MSPNVDPPVISDLKAAAQADVLLLATDFDGTVAPFMDDPSAVRPLPGAVEALAEAAALPGTTAALVSGRDLRTLASLSGAPESVQLIGSHGAESTNTGLAGTGTLTPQHREKLDQLAEVLTELQQRHPEARIERKAAAVVWHTRGMEPAQSARAMADAAEAASQRCGIEPMLGKNVVECAVLDASKGRALRALADTLGADAVVYLGDDVTDETVFTEFAGTPGALMIKVGPGQTAATIRLVGPEDAVATLEAIVQQRREVATRHA